MGCGVSKESAAGVLGNTVTQNGNSHGKSNGKVDPSSPNGKSAANGGVNGIDLQDPELEEAATRIQATYRGYTTRKTIKMSNQEEEEVGNAAALIQASFRGHQNRRQQEKADKAKAKADAELTQQMEKLKTKAAEEEEELPDLSDPELNKAATKIQAQFKGHMVRKTLTTKDEPSSN
ncbi:uncharacterized protein LOC110843654 isoform X2 [Folsomia candida]|uniref:uncharacterized protein LOC110843654 isoform X2 n=1 Tax=Folsomia candida TaxID=158441 RepID=UPI001604B292|nr:uncharacterized protein LOC110843654 isoform X2 [Folsomia candida]